MHAAVQTQKEPLIPLDHRVPGVSLACAIKRGGFEAGVFFAMVFNFLQASSQVLHVVFFIYNTGAAQNLGVFRRIVCND
jgi:hypothetical protein